MVVRARPACENTHAQGIATRERSQRYIFIVASRERRAVKPIGYFRDVKPTDPQATLVRLTGRRPLSDMKAAFEKDATASAPEGDIAHSSKRTFRGDRRRINSAAKSERLAGARQSGA